MIDTNNPIPLYLQLKEHIRELILTGKYADGDQIPTEIDWMNEFHLGRVTVRSALAELEREGIIYKRRGIGTFVSPKKSSSAFIPLISLNYPLRAMGLETESNIIESKLIFPDDELLREMHCTTKSNKGYMKRIRSVNHHRLAIEYSYLAIEVFDKLKNCDLSGSLATLLIEQADVNLEKMDQTIVTRMPTPEDAECLQISESQTVLELTRWIYEKDNLEPFSYVKFIMVDSLPNVIVGYNSK
ncbi:MAG: GntR family transcriptional regulator [Oscillospiraceae bacterium]